MGCWRGRPRAEYASDGGYHIYTSSTPTKPQAAHDMVIHTIVLLCARQRCAPSDAVRQPGSSMSFCQDRPCLWPTSRAHSQTVPRFDDRQSAIGKGVCICWQLSVHIRQTRHYVSTAHKRRLISWRPTRSLRAETCLVSYVNYLIPSISQKFRASNWLWMWVRSDQSI